MKKHVLVSEELPLTVVYDPDYIVTRYPAGKTDWHWYESSKQLYSCPTVLSYSTLQYNSFLVFDHFIFPQFIQAHPDTSLPLHASLSVQQNRIEQNTIEQNRIQYNRTEQNCEYCFEYGATAAVIKQGPHQHMKVEGTIVFVHFLLASNTIIEW